MIEWNKVYYCDCMDLDIGLPSLFEGIVDLVIADPPYFKIIGEKWDHIWRTKEDYIKWVLKWIKEVSRVLRIGGTFYLFGYFKTLAYIIPRLNEFGLELRQQIIIDKGIQAISGRATKKYKIFPNTTESILMIFKDNKKFVKPFLLEKQKQKKYTSKEINEKLGVKSNGGGMWSIYTGSNICEQFPTKERWHQFEEIFDFKRKYEKISQTFNPIMGLTNVWTDINFYREKRHHPTQKPLKLIKRLVEASSNQYDVVLDPFMGSGTTAVVSKILNRNYIGFEINPEYYEIAKKRIESTNVYQSIINFTKIKKNKIDYFALKNLKPEPKQKELTQFI